MIDILSQVTCQAILKLFKQSGTPSTQMAYVVCGETTVTKAIKIHCSTMQIMLEGGFSPTNRTLIQMQCHTEYRFQS